MVQMIENEVVGYDPRQKASSEETMTFDEWDKLKDSAVEIDSLEDLNRIARMKDFANIGPVKRCVDPAVGKDRSCIVTFNFTDIVFWLGICTGTVFGLVVGIIVMYVVKL